MKDENKTKKQLIEELTELRQRVEESEACSRAVSRVREQVWRMKSSREIEDVLVSVREELDFLAIPFNECGVNILGDFALSTVSAHRMITQETWIEAGPERGSEIFHQIWREGMVAYRRDLETEDIYQERAQLESIFGHPVRSVLDIPFSHGTLAVNSTEPHAFSDSDIIFLQKLAKVLADGFHRLDDLRQVEQRNRELKKEITEHKQAEEALRESETHLQGLFETMAEGVIFIAPDGQIVQANPAAERILGLKHSDIEARNYVTPEWEILRPDGTPMPPEELAGSRAMKDRRSVKNMVMGVKRPDDSIAWINVSAAPLMTESGEFEGVVGTFADITERKQAEEALKRSAQQWQKTFDAMPSMVTIISPDFEFLNVNRATCDATGIEREQLIGRKCYEIVHGTDAPIEAWSCTQALKTEKGSTNEFTQDGRHWRVSAWPMLEEDGEVKAFIHTIEDVTDRKVAERTREIQQAYDELKQTQVQLLQSAKLASIGQLAAGIAHEINNPVGFVKSNLNTLSQYARDLHSLFELNQQLHGWARAREIDRILAHLEAFQQRAEEVDLAFILEDFEQLISESQEGMERVRTIVQDLRGFAPINREEKGLAHLNDGLASTLNIVWNELKYKATVEKEYGEIPAVECYPQELNQVFMNLLVNALQAIEEKGTITIRTYAENGYVCVAISDTGKGMPPEVEERIFEPFYTTKEVGKGTGLGLSIAYNIVEKHGGEIRVDSQVGKGTTFTVRIPAKPSVDDGSSERSA